jgi:hypothetical protein
MIPKKPAPDLIRGGSRFSEKIMLKQKLDFDPIPIGSKSEAGKAQWAIKQ